MTSAPSTAGSHLVSIGDLYVDLVVDLDQVAPRLSFSELTSSSNCFGDVSRQAGGSALQVARAAVDSGSFARATCIGAIGGPPGQSGQPDQPDRDGQLLLDAAAAWGVSMAVACIPGESTGEVVAVYDGNGARLMVSCRGANALLEPDVLGAGMVAAAAEATVLHVSGYTLLQPRRWEAVQELTAITRRAGGMVAVDLAPHDIDRLLDPTAIVRALSDQVDCLIVDLALLRRLAFAHGHDPPSDDALLRWGTARFGRLVVLPSPSRVRVVTDDGPPLELDVPYQSGVASRGQSAAVQASVLGRLMGLVPG